MTTEAIKQHTGAPDAIKVVMALEAAFDILNQASRELCTGSMPPYRFVEHAKGHIENQIEQILRGEL